VVQVFYSKLFNPSDCVILEASGDIFIGVHGYQSSSYRLLITPLNASGMRSFCDRHTC
jgi:hypothetical protein